MYSIKGINNNAVTLNQSVEQSGDVQTAYQRRNDLIGNLVNTVKELLILKKH
jgi:LemA protein